MEQREKDIDDEIHETFRIGRNQRKFKKWFKENIWKNLIAILMLIVTIVALFKK